MQKTNKKIEAYLITSTLHTHAACEHDTTIEQNIRTLKDRTRSTVHSVPYRKMPLPMIDPISEQAQSMLNDFVSNTEISTTLSARNFI